MEKTLKQVNVKNKKEKTHYDELNWFKLDNAALIYPAVSTNKWNAVFRVSVVLLEPIKKEVLSQAVKDVLPRFPHFNVSLNRGIFWFYFQEAKAPFHVKEDNNYPCKKMEFKRNKHLFRVLYYNKKISFEAFHALTDGFGALVFLNTLVARYLTLLGHKIEGKEGILNYLDKPSFCEVEDSFSRHANLKTRNPWKENKAYQITGTEEEYGKLNIINGVMSANSVKQKAKEYDATVNEFLLAHLFRAVLSYQKQQGKTKRPVRISVPINLRNIFSSKSLRNFSSYMNLEFASQESELSLEEVIQKIKARTRSINKDYVMGNINANVKAQKNILLRLTPLVIKNLVLKLVFSIVGERIFTMSLSNLGKIQTPEEFKDYIDKYEVNLGTGKLNAMGVAVVTFEDKLVLTFSSKIKETEIEKEFFTALTKMGIEVNIESNL